MHKAVTLRQRGAGGVALVSPLLPRLNDRINKHSTKKTIVLAVSFSYRVKMVEMALVS